MTETWKQSPSFPDYEVSNLGRVRSHKRGGPKLLNPKPDAWGRVRTMLIRNGQRHIIYIHRLVAEAFLGSCRDGCKVYHLDGDRSNNRADNLAYGTHAEIIAHWQALGLWPSGETAGPAKLTNKQAQEARDKFASGKWTQEGLADHYHVTRVAMNMLLRGKTYPYAGGPTYKSQPVDKAAIKRDLEAGKLTGSEIAKLHSVSASYVSKVKHGKQ